MYILSQTQGLNVRYAPLLIHHFALCVPRKILDATKFQQRYHKYEEIENIPDRLRWCRYSRGLTQAEVAQLYRLPVKDFMDAYNRFLYRGQADCTHRYRAETGLGQKAFARKTGIPYRSLQAWESGKKTVSRQSWEKYFCSGI